MLKASEKSCHVNIGNGILIHLRLMASLSIRASTIHGSICRQQI